MNETFERQRIIECMFDPITSSLLAELEDEEKDCLLLAQKFNISEKEVFHKFSYLIDHGFVVLKLKDGKSIFSANSEKLSEIVENTETFGATIEGLEKMDSFLN